MTYSYNAVLFRFCCAVLLNFTSAIQSHGQAEINSTGIIKSGFVQIGNHKLFIEERGDKKAKYTIVFESGAGGTSQDWKKVIAELPAEAHTICYDRAGSGKSEKGPLPQTM